MKTKTRDFLLSIFALMILACASLVITFSVTKKVYADEVEVKFTGAECAVYIAEAPASNLINGEFLDYAAVGAEEGLTGFFQTETPIILSFDEAKVINRLIVSMFPGMYHTSAYRVEVSLDKETWAPVTLIARGDDVIYNNEIVQKSDYTATNDLFIDFNAVSCKYVKLTMVMKEGWGGALKGIIAEIRAYNVNNAQATAVTMNKKLNYTATATSVQAGETTVLNDGVNKYFSNPMSAPSLIIYQNGTITFDLGDNVAAKYIRVFPNGPEVANATGLASEMSLNEGALVNNHVAKGLKFEVSNDGNTWIEVGNYTNIQPYVFAQTFALSTAEAYKYLKMSVTQMGNNENFTSYAEVEIFGVTASAPVTYNKVAFTSVEGVSWETNNFPLSNVINGDETDIATVGSDELTSFFQTDEPMLLSFDEAKAINRLDIALWSGIVGRHTSAYRIEVSNDKETWAPVKIKDTSVATIYNNEIVSAKTRNDNHIIVDFEAVTCKYVKVTIVIKDSWGVNCHGVLSEITAYASSDIGTPEEPITYKQLNYTATKVDPQSVGDISLINDGNRYFANANVGSFILFAADGHDSLERYIQFAFTDTAKVSYIRLIPNGYEAKNKEGAVNDEGAGFPINEDALKNTQVAQEYLFEGSVDGVTWVTIGSAKNVQPLVCAQTFKLDDTTAYKYIRLKVKAWNAESAYTSFNEIELFGTEVKTPDVATLKLSNEGCKTAYIYNETLDLTNVSVLYKAVGEEETTVAVTPEMVSGFNAKKVGQQTVTITYEGLSVTYNVTVGYPALQGTKVEFTKAETNNTQFCNEEYQKAQIIDGNYTTEVILGSWGQTDFYNFFEPVVLTISGDEAKLIDNVRVYLKPNLTHTSAFMIEVSNDKESWARVNYIADNSVIIENNAVRLSDITNDYIDILFEGVTVKYVKITMLLKEYDGGVCLGKITEIEASATSSATNHELTFVKEIDYTCTTVSEQSEGGANVVNDNQNLYFGQDGNSLSLILFGGREESIEKMSEASVILTLNDYVRANKIRLYPNGYEVKYIHPLNEGVVDANAFVNRSLPKAFTVYGSCDGETYVELKKYTDVKPYNFAQEFDISSKYTVKYIKIVVDKLNEENENFSLFTEIEVFGNVVENFEYSKIGTIKVDTAKQLYLPNETLDVSNMYITVTSNDGGIITDRVKVTEEMVTGFNTTTFGTYNAVITYQGVTCDYAYAVATITGITVKTNPTKTVYKVGETLDVTGMIITVSYEYEEQTGSFDVDNLLEYVTLDTSVANNTAKLTVTYQGETTTVDVVVKDISAIAVNSTTHKTSYYMGAKLNVTGLTIEVTYTDGTAETIDVSSEMVTGFTSAKAVESLPLTITYGGKTTTYNVEVKSVEESESTEGKVLGCKKNAITLLSVNVIITMFATAFVLRKRK